MRIDVVSIFPDYFAPLALSLPGRARRTGLLDLHVHDLRDWTTDRHRTVDDTPYGGGPGMVMKPEPWGAALDALVAGTQDPPPVLVVPSPSGRPFTQAIAGQLAQEPRLLFACGRYEGIDQRVVDRAATRMRVLEVSLGDYVLNGGEVAALAMIEAVVRLLPGFLGNQQSLVEESHGEDRLLEGPVYTKPESWSGLDVPEVLLSGDHASIAAWRRARSLDRTAERRPDLAYPARTLRPGELPALAEGEDGVPEGKQAQWGAATHADAGELLTLQRACWVQEALANDTLAIPALHESLTDVEEDLARWLTLLLRFGGRLVGSVRAQRRGDEPELEWLMGRLMVAPDLQGRGIGRWMLTRIEEAAPPGTRWITLVTGARSEDNLRMYRRAGYRPAGVQPDPAIVTLRKRLR